MSQLEETNNRIDELRKMRFRIDELLLQFQDRLTNESNIHRVYLARKRLFAVALYHEEGGEND